MRYVKFSKLTCSHFSVSSQGVDQSYNMAQRARKTLSPNMRAARRECYNTAALSIPQELRAEFILVGGAGTLLSGAPERSTQDLDFAAGQGAMNAFLKVVQAGQNGFKRDDDESIMFWSSLGFFVPVDLLVLGGDFVESVNAVQQIDSGFVASVPDLMNLRAITIEERGDSQDFEDFIDLMKLALDKGIRFGLLKQEEMGRILFAAKKAGDYAGVDPSLIMPMFTLWVWQGSLRGRIRSENEMIL